MGIKKLKTIELEYCVDSIVDDMLETALWATTDYDDDCLDSKYEVTDISSEFASTCRQVVSEFMKKSHHLISQEEYEEENVGHNLWLTIHGHGAGFWDGDFKYGDKISEICRNIEGLEDDLIGSLEKKK